MRFLSRNSQGPLRRLRRKNLLLGGITLVLTAGIIATQIVGYFVNRKK